MKLRNKKTGEIIERYTIETARAIGVNLILQDDDTNKHYQYNSFAEFCAEWEDYEEPHWFIGDGGEVMTTDREPFDKYAKQMQSIGNYFETKEEAKKAVERLRAWKRLKDNGFKFTAYQLQELIIKFFLDHGYTKMGDDLDLLFGGEE